MMDVFKSFGSKLFGKTMKQTATKGAEKAVTAAATKTGEHAGKKAGDKKVKMLSKGKPPSPAKYNTPKKATFNNDVKTVPKKMTVQDINQRVSQILSGDGICKRTII